MTNDDIAALRQEIDRLDTEIIELIQKRTDASRQIGRIRKNVGGPRIVPEREAQIRERYAHLGQPGEQIISALLILGRGPNETA
jgi:chorismate mutase